MNIVSLSAFREGCLTAQYEIGLEAFQREQQDVELLKSGCWPGKGLLRIGRNGIGFIYDILATLLYLLGAGLVCNQQSRGQFLAKAWWHFKLIGHDLANVGRGFIVDICLPCNEIRSVQWCFNYQREIRNGWKALNVLGNVVLEIDQKKQKYKEQVRQMVILQNENAYYLVEKPIDVEVELGQPRDQVLSNLVERFLSR